MYISIATALVKGPFGIASRRASKIASLGRSYFAAKRFSKQL